jgi:hypothetical protein
MYAVDAANAVKNFPDEWSFNPWPAAPAHTDKGVHHVPA